MKPGSTSVPERMGCCHCIKGGEAMTVRVLLKGICAACCCWIWMVLQAGATAVHTEKDVALLLELEDGPGVVEALNQAQSQVVQRQAKRNRSIRMEGIRDFFDLSDKYTAVAYAATIQPDTPAVAMVLFERGATSLLIPRNFPYLLFVGATDIATYERIDDAGICGYFREMGVADCVPVFTQRKWKQMLSEKADKKHSHDLSTLTGVLPAERLDPSLVRRSELKAALEAKADINLVQPLLLGAVAVSTAAVTGPDNEQLQQRIVQLEAQVARLTRLLDGIQRTGQDLQFQGMNLVLLNGEGKTASANGSGNLIIGYNSPEKITGSHNLIIGEGHQCTTYGSILSGSGHRVEGAYGAALAGSGNSVTGKGSFAMGGEGNQVGGNFSATVAGRHNKAEGERSIISGGENRAVLKSNPHFTGE